MNRILILIVLLSSISCNDRKTGTRVAPVESPDRGKMQITEGTPAHLEDDRDIASEKQSLADTSNSFTTAAVSIAEEIKRLIGNPKEITSEHWHILMSRYWRPGFDVVVGKNPESSSIIDMLDTPENEVPLIAQIVGGSFIEIPDKSEQESLHAIYFLALVIATGGGESLPVAFERRRSEAEITRGDIFLFEIFNDAFTEVNRKSVVDFDLEQWTLMANSTNDLHRLLALRTYRSVARNHEDLLDFYQNYVSESDLGILREVVVNTYTTMRPEGVKILSSILSRTDVQKDKELVSKLNDCIQDLNSRKSQDKE